MNKKILITITAVLAVIVLGIGVTVSVIADNDPSEPFCEKFQKMIRTTISEQDLDIDISLPSELTEEQKAQVMSDYTKTLDGIFAKDSYLYENNLNAMQIRLNSERTTRELVPECGFFNMDVESFEINGETAVLKISYDLWSKYVKEYNSNNFKAIFPVSESTREITFKKVDGEWLISDEKYIHYVFDGDVEKEKVFSVVSFLF